MNIPLVKTNKTDDINASVIALIKALDLATAKNKELEQRINQLEKKVKK